jgi:hypothetical protein
LLKAHGRSQIDALLESRMTSEASSRQLWSQ